MKEVEKMKKYLLVFVLAALLLGLMPGAVAAQDFTPIVPLTDPLAPFLESRAYAAQQGATAEFRKMEWVAFDPESMTLYLSMTEISKSMSDGEGDIQLEENKCGIVYSAEVDSDYNISSLVPLIVGGPYDSAATDRCALDNIANPDSMWVDPYGNLWIGEDTSNHKNNAIWRWDGENLERFATLPIGSEATGVMITPAGDLVFSIQHPSAINQYPYTRATVMIINNFNSNDDFEPVEVPSGDDMHTLVVAKGTPQVLIRPGEAIPNDLYAQRYGQIERMDGSLMEICNLPDANIFIPTMEDASEGYLFTNFECVPGGVSKIYIRKYTSGWRVLEGENIDFDGVLGTWNNCGSSLTPWTTVLTSEEYEPFADRATYKQNVTSLTDYLGEQANPYDYGYLVELIPDPYGYTTATLVEKRYSIGRFSHEMGFVMPDGKTIIHGDDGSNVVLFKTVADEAGDLSANTIYAAKITQNADDSLAIEWIELGHATDDEIAERIAKITLP